jgi:hypothetical protein
MSTSRWVTMPEAARLVGVSYTGLAYWVACARRGSKRHAKLAIRGRGKDTLLNRAALLSFHKNLTGAAHRARGYVTAHEAAKLVGKQHGDIKHWIRMMERGASLFQGLKVIREPGYKGIVYIQLNSVLALAPKVEASKSKHGCGSPNKRSPEYVTWVSMKQRCYNPKFKSFKHYGGRGITVCESWRQDFRNFLKNVGAKPSPRHQLDRIDNNKGYYPGNVRWATPNEQSRNRRSTVFLTFRGECKPLITWCEQLGISRLLVAKRVRTGWEHEKALTTPSRQGACITHLTI